MPVVVQERFIETNEDLLFELFDYEDALRTCNDQLEDARQWGR